MSDDERTVTLEAEAIAATKLALLCNIDGEEHWIPQSQIHDDSEVFEKGHQGKLVITEWFAKKEGLI